MGIFDKLRKREKTQKVEEKWGRFFIGGTFNEEGALVDSSETMYGIKKLGGEKIWKIYSQ